MNLREENAKLFSSYYLKSRSILDNMSGEQKYGLVSPNELTQRDTVLHGYFSQLGFSFQQVVETYAYSKAANEISNEVINEKMCNHWKFVIRNREANTLILRIESHIDYIAFIMNEILAYHNEGIDFKEPYKISFNFIAKHVKSLKSTKVNLDYDIKSLQNIIEILAVNKVNYKSLRNINTHRYLIAIDHIGIEANRAGFNASDKRKVNYSVNIDGDEINYYSTHEVKYSDIEKYAIEMIKKVSKVEEIILKTFAFRRIVYKIY